MNTAAVGTLSHSTRPQPDSKFPAPPVWEGLPGFWTVKDGTRSIVSALEGEDETQYGIAVFGLMLTSLLLHKNSRYGNSATDPVEVFARGLSPHQRMGVRMDDKISRIMRGSGTPDGEAPEVDLAGYIVLQQVLNWLERDC